MGRLGERGQERKRQIIGTGHVRNMSGNGMWEKREISGVRISHPLGFLMFPVHTYVCVHVHMYMCLPKHALVWTCMCVYNMCSQVRERERKRVRG